MPLTIPSIFTAVNKFSGPLGKMGSDVAKFGGRVASGMRRADHAVSHYSHVLNHAQEHLLEMVGTAALAYKVVQGIEYGVEGVIEYDKAIRHLSAEFNLTSKTLPAYRDAINLAAHDTYKGASEVENAFELIGSKNPELKKSAKGLGEVAESSIMLSEAWGKELGPTASSVTKVMAGFGKEAEESGSIVNVLAAASQAGAVKNLELADAVGIAASESKRHNVSLEQTAAMIQLVDQKTNLGAAGAEKLGTVYTKLEKVQAAYKSGQFNIIDALEAVKKKYDSLKSARQKDALLTDLFGKKNVKVGATLVNNIEQFQELTKSVTGTSAAQEQAEGNTKSFEESLERLKKSFLNTITGADSTTGALGYLNDGAVWLYKHMDTVVAIGGGLIALFLAWKAGMMGLTLVTGLYNVALGVSEAITGTYAASMVAGSVAQKAAMATARAYTAIQWLFNASLYGCPLVWIIAGIAALVGAFLWLKGHVSGWGAQWDEIVGFATATWNVFKAGLQISFLMIADKFKVMTETIYKAWIWVQNKMGKLSDEQYNKQLGQISDMQKARQDEMKGIATAHEGDLKRMMKGVDWKLHMKTDAEKAADKKDSKKETLDMSKARTDYTVSRTEETQKQQLSININDPGNKATVDRSQAQGVPVQLSSTMTRGK